MNEQRTGGDMSGAMMGAAAGNLSAVMTTTAVCMAVFPPLAFMLVPAAALVGAVQGAEAGYRDPDAGKHYFGYRGR
ncbi:MAG: hypothetical protein AAF661_09045 [Pseudomonadota bacterium]